MQCHAHPSQAWRGILTALGPVKTFVLPETLPQLQAEVAGFELLFEKKEPHKPLSLLPVDLGVLFVVFTYPACDLL